MEGGRVMKKLKEKVIRKLQERDGVGTIEIVVILGILLGIALLFRETVVSFVKGLMAEFFDTNDYTQPISGLNHVCMIQFVLKGFHIKA